MLVTELICEFKKLWRDPSFVIPTFGFPSGFFLLFGVILPFAKNPQAQWIAIANYAAIGVIAGSLFASGLPLSAERESGVYALKRSTPLSLRNYLLGKVLAASALAVLSSMAVLLLGIISYQMLPSFTEVVAFVFWCGFGSLCFSGFGIWIGSKFRTHAAAAIINLLFMPLVFLGGLMLPLQAFPSMFQKLAHLLPSFHLGEVLRAGLSPQLALAASNYVIAWGILLALAIIGLTFTRLQLRNAGA